MNTDEINHPPHYQGKGMEAIDVMEAFDLDRYESAIVKYVLRWKKKNGVRDLKKAGWWLDRLIKRYETTGYSAFYDVSNQGNQT